MADLLADAVWTAVRTPPGEAPTPAGLAGYERLPALVPGTAGGVLRAAGLALTCDLDDQDWWWETTLPAVAGALLRVGGLATVGEVWVGEECVHRGGSMFLAADLPLPDVAAGTPLRLACRALGPLLRARRPRPSWRTRLVGTQNLRWHRTALLGRLTGDDTTPAPVGPWRGLCLLTGPVRDFAVVPRVSGDRATVDVTATLASAAGSVRASVGGVPVTLTGDGTRFRGSADVSSLARWWPYGYGDPVLHDAVLEVDGDPAATARVGLREITRGRGDVEGLEVMCNGRRIFARGVVWSPLDPVTLQNDPDRLAASLDALRRAGLNTIRVPGTMGYEDEAFYTACDERGVLVWQDLAMANLDPPSADPDWRALLDAEVAQLGARVTEHPCVAVVCGGSESEQQAVMTGVEDYGVSLGALLTDLRAAAPATFPGAVWVDNSPTGGDRPFGATPGVTHWYGVGAYRGPLSDAETADVGFAAECLAFSNPPEPQAVRSLGGAEGAGHRPDWKRGIPRDAGSSWDFEDVTHHYVRALLDRDPVAERWADPEHALDLSRAAVVEAMARTLTTWRSPRSRCAGALVLSAHDLRPGAGWGLLDADGRPKAPLQALADVCAPTAVLVEDRGLDGVLVHVVHDGPDDLDGRLLLDVYDLDGQRLGDADAAVRVPPAGSLTFDAEVVLGGFRDLNHAHAFGPPRYDVLRARLDVGGVVVAEATHLLLGPVRPRVADIGLTAVAGEDERGLTVTVTTRGAAQRVAFDLPRHVPEVGWFHLAPGASRTVRLHPVGDPADGPLGTVRALNARRPARIDR